MAYTTDMAAMLADPEIDVVEISTPHSTHYALTRAAPEAGRDVVCEKPLASNEREAAKLADLAKEHGVFLWEAVVTTRQPNFRLVRDELLAKIGTIKAVSVNYSQYSSRYDAFRAGEVLPAFDPAKAGGAILVMARSTSSWTGKTFTGPKSVFGSLWPASDKTVLECGPRSTRGVCAHEGRTTYET